jgi:hypothetical protein
LNSLRFIAKGLQANRDRLGDLAAGHVERRVAWALLRLARAPAPRLGGAVTAVGLPHQDLADYAGTNIYSVSRILGRWRRFGIIETGRAWVGILDTGWLTSIADGSPPSLQASLTPRSKYRFASTCAQSRRFPKGASTR